VTIKNEHEVGEDMSFRKKLQLYILPILLVSILMITAVVIYISNTRIQSLQYDIMRYRLEVVKEYAQSEYETLKRVNVQNVDLYVEESKARIYEFINSTEVPGGYFLIVDSNNGLVFHSDESQSGVILPESTSEYFRNNIGNTEITKFRYDSKLYLTYFDYFEPWDWFVVVVADREVIFEDVNSAINISLLTSMAALIIAVVSVNIISRSISKPIEDLSEGTLALKKGNYNVRVAKGNNDEFGELAESFNTMAKEIEDNFTQIRSKSESLSLLASFAAGMAHDLKTPIGNTTTVISYLETELENLRKTYNEEKLSKDVLERFLESSKEATDIITKNTQQASELINGYKTVSVDQLNREKRWIDLEKYFEEILLALRPRLKNTNVNVNINCPETIKIWTYPGAISQIVTNLIVNSLVHGFENREHGLINIELNKNNNDISMIYNDNGVGISEDNLKNIYDAFFTTKHGQGGSGLGMHIIYNLVKSLLHGTVECESEQGEGVEFTIVFPDESFDS